MKAFTCTEAGGIKHWDSVDEVLITMAEGDVKQLRDELAEFFCAHGWGEADDVETGERKPGVVVLSPEHSKQIKP